MEKQERLRHVLTNKADLKQCKENNEVQKNCGFSLVELIVVVLIMAIIAVSLAPQVMKWVENSRVATDCSNYDTLVSAAAVAMAESEAYGEVCNQTTATTISAQDYSTDWVISPTGGMDSELYKAIAVTLGENWANEIRPRSAFADNYVITINTDGTIERTNAPKGNTGS